MEINEYIIKLIQISKDVENLQLFSDVAKLSKTEFRMLREIAIEQKKGREIISSELARRLGITRSAVSQLVTKLEERGILVRAASPVDRKIAYVRLSEKSRKMVQEQCREANELMDKIAVEYGLDRMEALFASFEEFIAMMNRVRRELRASAKAQQSAALER